MNDQALLALGGLLFCTGLFVILTKRSSIFILLGIELMLNAANINFVVFSRYDTTIQGQMAAIFVMVIAVAEVAAALAIIFKIHQYFQSTDLQDINELKG